MERGVARSVLASLVLALAVWSSSAAWALDPGNYTIQCASPEGAASDVATFDIRMDMVDLLTMKYTYGAVISGVRVDDGKRVILTGDRGCALTEVRRRSTK
jgi:hypothetical protein